jgi:hypothetical protein
LDETASFGRVDAFLTAATRARAFGVSTPPREFRKTMRDVE